MAKGKFITFEGPEGSGKTTQARRLIERLEAAGANVLYTREPGGTATGEAIRDILQHDKAGEDLCDETEVLLFAASRAQLVRKVILPALDVGTHVVCDRFADSTTAYQGYGRGFDVDQMLAINAFAIADAIPDVTLLLDVETKMGFERIEERQAATGSTSDRIEREERSFHERIREGYLALAERWPDRFKHVDAAGDVEAVEAKVWEVVQRVLA